MLFENGGMIDYVYDAAGVKLQKCVTQNTQLTTTDYLDRYQYVASWKFYLAKAKENVNTLNISPL